MPEQKLVDQEYIDAHPESGLIIGDPTPEVDPSKAAADVADQVPPPHEVPATPEPQRDLDQERDDRVIPVAQGVISDLAGLDSAPDMNDRSEFTKVIVSVLKRSLAADLNITTDNSYIFQLVLGAFGAFNQTVMSCKMAEPQNTRYSKIAHEMMALLAGANVPMGMKVKTEDQVAALESIKPQLEEIFAREMLTNLEITYILEGLMNALKVTEQVYNQNITDSVQRMEAKILEIDDMTDLTMTKLDWALSTGIDQILKKDDEQKKAE